MNSSGVIIFNPRSADAKHRIPNSILQVGSSIEGKFPYHLVDGNLEKQPLQTLFKIIDEENISILGMTVMPGPQLKQAIPFSKEIHFVDANPFVALTFGETNIKSNLIGAYNFANITAAITIGTYFNVDKKTIKKAIESYVPTNNRSQIIEKEFNKIILDAYNANPSSMEVALENFASLKENSKTIILGDMFELGKTSKQEHQNIVDLATKLGFDNLFFVGENFYQTKTKKNQFKTYKDLEDFIKKNPLENQKILIKGSRGMCLERILESIS